MRTRCQSMLRLGFLWHSRFTLADMLNNWQDGLRGALTLLADKWSVRVFAPYGEAQATVNGLGITMTPGAESCLQACKDWKPDIVLCWGSIDRPLHARVRELGVPTGLCFPSYRVAASTFSGSATRRLRCLQTVRPVCASDG